jgi:putative transposon-encoded protein
MVINELGKTWKEEVTAVFEGAVSPFTSTGREK